MDICTIAARNYLSNVRVLAESFLRHHPGGRCLVFVLDDPDGREDFSSELFIPLTAAEVGLEDDFPVMATIYDVTELATAIKPWILRALLDRGAESATFIDPDVEVFAPIDDVEPLSVEHAVILTPHTLAPMERDGCLPDEREILLAGIYNLGFVSVSQRARHLLEWWAERLRWDCLVAKEDGLHVDQRWIDFVPGYFEHLTLRDPGFNVAYWNVDKRDLTWTGERFEALGHPLRFFHFSGFSPESPYELSKHTAQRPRVRVSEHPALVRLCMQYKERLEAMGWAETSRQPYGFGTMASGLRIDRTMRRLYRTSLLTNDPEQPRPPFTDEGARQFVDWLNSRVNVDRLPGVTRYLLARWRDDARVQMTFPDLGAGSNASFLHWASRRQEEGGGGVPGALVPDQDTPAGIQAWPPVRTTGTNVVGYVNAESGVGEYARLLIETLEAAGEHCAVVPYRRTVLRQLAPFVEGPVPPEHDVTIVAVNADQLSTALQDMGPNMLADRYTIGMWSWEVEAMPAELAHSGESLDEIWAISEHAAGAIRRVTTRPVHVFPCPIAEAQPVVATRRDLGLPEGFVFLFCFDFHSVFTRKNPLAVVAAYTEAFHNGEDAHLVIKSVNGDAHPEMLTTLRTAAAGRSDVQVINGYVSSAEQRAFMQHCDAYVSLHRAEGFGLTLAEAMMAGKPVIATGYSGNLEFMTADNSYLVPYRLVPIGPGCEPYPADARWAEPDVGVAAQLMREIFDDPETSRARGRRARDELLGTHGVPARAEFVRRRLGEIRAGRPRPVDARPEVVASSDVGSSGGEAGRVTVGRPPAHWSETARRGVRRLASRVVYRVVRPALPDDDLAQRVDALVRNIDAEARTRDAMVSSHASSWLVEHDGALERLAEGIDRVAERQRAVEGWARIALTAAREQELKLARTAGEIWEMMDARPFTADDRALRVRDPLGRDTIGFSKGLSDGPASYPSFEDLFRGSEDLVREMQRPYVDLLRHAAPVLDLGCGRGEMLDLLRDAGIEALGVDLDGDMVRRAGGRGHDVIQADALEYLSSQPDGQLGAVFSAQFIEHLPYRLVRELATTASAKLRPGGLFIAETVNPHSLRALKTFWLDPAHQQPLYPEALVWLCRELDYSDAFVFFPGGSGRLDEDLRYVGQYAVVARNEGGDRGSRR